MEINFQSDDQDIVSPEYLELLRKKGLLLWCNSIKLNHRDVLAGTFDDDISVLCDPDRGWGRLLDMGFHHGIDVIFHYALSCQSSKVAAVVRNSAVGDVI